MSASLSSIVDVSVEVSSVATITSDFDLGLIIGTTKMASAPGTMKIYDAETYATQIVTDGYATTDPEYKAAAAYFSQSPAPSRVAIGVAVADETVTTNPDYAATLAALKNVNDSFYGIVLAGVNISANPSDYDDFFAAVEASGTPKVCFVDITSAFTTQTTDIATYYKDRGYNRVFTFHNSSATAFVAPAVLGLISGLNSMRANSAYTATYKSLVGVTPEDLTQTELTFLVENNANVYCNFGDRYSFTYPFISCKGYHMDEVYFIDAAKFLIQQSVVSMLVSQRKVPQTESGMTMIINTIAAACEQLAEIGFISGGIWRGETVQDLKNGDAMQSGYYIQAGSIAAQPAADRAARKTPTIYVALLSSGAIEHVVIRVFIAQ